MQLWLGHRAAAGGDALKLLFIESSPDRGARSRKGVFILRAPEASRNLVGFDMDIRRGGEVEGLDGTIRIMKRPEFEKPPESGSVGKGPRESARRAASYGRRGSRAVGGVAVLCVRGAGTCATRRGGGDDAAASTRLYRASAPHGRIEFSAAAVAAVS